MGAAREVHRLALFFLAGATVCLFLITDSVDGADSARQFPTPYRSYTRYLRYIRRPSYHRETHYIREGNGDGIYISTGGTSSMSGGVIAGAVVGGVAFLAIVIGLIVYCCRQEIQTPQKAQLSTKESQLGTASEASFPPYKPQEYTTRGYPSTSSTLASGPGRSPMPM